MDCHITKQDLYKARKFIKEHKPYDLNDPTLEIRDIHRDDQRYIAANILKQLSQPEKYIILTPMIIMIMETLKNKHKCVLFLFLLDKMYYKFGVYRFRLK